MPMPNPSMDQQRRLPLHQHTASATQQKGMATSNSCLKIYQVDAFATKVFEGNPAAVIPLPGPSWPDDTKMQAIARENNLSETAFLIANDSSVLGSNTCAYSIRWFTPNGEVDLCGHATLGSAYVVFRFLASAGKDKIEFNTKKSGTLYVSRENVTSGDNIGLLRMDFPADIPTPVVATASVSTKLVSDALGGADVSGASNIAIGSNAADALTSGACNIALGLNALGASTDGCDNV